MSSDPWEDGYCTGFYDAKQRYWWAAWCLMWGAIGMAVQGQRMAATNPKEQEDTGLGSRCEGCGIRSECADFNCPSCLERLDKQPISEGA